MCLIVDFFWGGKTIIKKFHWVSWRNLCFPYTEGGIGIRHISEVCSATHLKQWWVFRTKDTLWGSFLKFKYCQRVNLVARKWSNGHSLVWKHMMRTKIEAKKHILWRLKFGTCYFWWDNWSGMRPLHNLRTDGVRSNNVKVASFLSDKNWDVQKLVVAVPSHLLRPILKVSF